MENQRCNQFKYKDVVVSYINIYNKKNINNLNVTVQIVQLWTNCFLQFNNFLNLCNPSNILHQLRDKNLIILQSSFTFLTQNKKYHFDWLHRCGIQRYIVSNSLALSFIFFFFSSRVQSFNCQINDGSCQNNTEFQTIGKGNKCWWTQ